VERGIVVCDGEWDLARAGELAARMSAAAASGESVLVLDFRASDFVDATTVGAICRFADELEDQGRRLAVTCSDGPVRRLFALVRMAERVPVVVLPEAAPSASPVA
jgi:anti-anti-sigma factor